MRRETANEERKERERNLIIVHKTQEASLARDEGEEKEEDQRVPPLYRYLCFAAGGHFICCRRDSAVTRLQGKSRSCVRPRWRPPEGRAEGMPQPKERQISSIEL